MPTLVLVLPVKIRLVVMYNAGVRRGSEDFVRRQA